MLVFNKKETERKIDWDSKDDYWAQADSKVTQYSWKWLDHLKSFNGKTQVVKINNWGHRKETKPCGMKGTSTTKV